VTLDPLGLASNDIISNALEELGKTDDTLGSGIEG
jgi:hypothetical protein